MKRILTFAIVCGFSLSVLAQTTTREAIQKNIQDAKEKLEAWDTETILDSLDQEKLPKIVSGGLFAGANVSNFIITHAHQSMSSHMRIGAEFGGFLDFYITKHFAIQPQIIFTAQQNYFGEKDTTNRLWSFGAEIPIYFLGRFGNLQKGYVQFGGGVFTHFTFLSNVQDKYSNIDQNPSPSSISQRIMEDENTNNYELLYRLHNNHFGICALVGYEFAFGMQINASYRVSLSDIAGFYKEMKGKEEANSLIYPQSISLSIGYRWR